MRRFAFALMAVTAVPLAAQDNAVVQSARQAYNDLDFAAAIRQARRALGQQLSQADRVNAYEVLGFSLGALDSTRQAVDAFRELIYLNPDREPDVSLVSPRITSLYASALGQVLVVRRLGMDSASFVAGAGGAFIRFAVSRPARVTVRVVGLGVDRMIDSLLVSGTNAVRWDGLGTDAGPVPAGDYQVIVSAVEGANEFAAPLAVRVTHGAVDTLPHLTNLPGYTELEERVAPPRNFRPLGISVLFSGVAAGAALAFENQLLGVSDRGIGGVAGLVMVVGLVSSLQRPDPEPVEANIRYNELLRQQLADRNTDIATRNEALRRSVQLTIAEVASQ